MKKIFFFIIFFLVSSFSVLIADEKLQAAKIKAEQICSGCHGLNGIASSAGNSVIIPNLTSQNKEYLIAKLKDYKSAKINHPQMTLIAQMLTDEDIENVSTWYSSIEIKILTEGLENIE